MDAISPPARFLMCRPEYFAVSYTINPWMDPRSWARDKRAQLAARHEWANLHDLLLGLGVAVELISPEAGLPDLVFTANAGVVLDRKVLLARFRHPERQQEEPHFERAFRSLQARGLVNKVERLPRNIVLEGAGDCVWDAARKLFWIGYGPRSDAGADRIVSQIFGQEVVALELADDRFYHMDTALCPLAGGEFIYLPSAFTSAGLAEIRTRVAARNRIEISDEDGCRLAANAVCVGRTVVMSSASDQLIRKLNTRGYAVLTTPLASFLRSGGSASCLALRLDLMSIEAAASPEQAAVA